MKRPELFGCEFEFILNSKEDEVKLHDELKELKDGVCVKQSSTKSTIESDEKYECIHFKAEPSLESTLGREITIPKCTSEELYDYIDKISVLIPKYGYTNETCGFHVHMSSDDEELNFCLFVLIADKNGLLKKWGSRNKYCLNLIDIFQVLNFKDVLYFKNSKGRVWNLLHRGKSWIEVRTMGGTDYETKQDEIKEDIKQFIDVYTQSYDKVMNEDYLLLLKKHTDRMEAMDEKVVIDYLTAFPEIKGFLDIEKVAEFFNGDDLKLD